jgi:hypothetical protein
MILSAYSLLCLLISRLFFINFIIDYSCKPGLGYIPYIALITVNLILLLVMYGLRIEQRNNPDSEVKAAIAVVTSLEIIALSLLFGLISTWLWHALPYRHIISLGGSMMRSAKSVFGELVFSLVWSLSSFFMASLLVDIALVKTKEIWSIGLFKAIGYLVLTAIAMSVVILISFVQLDHPALTQSAGSQIGEGYIDFCSVF